MAKKRRFRSTEKRRRHNYYVKDSTHLLIIRAAESGNCSMGVLIDNLVEQKLADPIQSKKDEVKKLAIEIARIQDEIKFLEEFKEEGKNK